MDIQGRVGGLIEVAAGFHPDLTGRENVYLQGAIMGMPRAEIARKFDAIVDFSGVDEFIDTPVKRYSSGMNARLGFAIAAHLDPDVLLIDEVLSVGDVGFQAGSAVINGQSARPGDDAPCSPAGSSASGRFVNSGAGTRSVPLPAIGRRF